MRLALLASFAVALPVIAADSTRDETPPHALARAVAAQIAGEARAAKAASVRVTLEGDAPLAGVPALLAAGRELEDRLFADGAFAAKADGEAADVEVALVLSRTAGRIALGGAVHTRAGRTAWVLASAPETPEWIPWLTGLSIAETDAAGFSFGRAGALANAVLDADGGDLDGDGIAELVALTREEVIALAVSSRGVEVIARAPLPPAEPAEVATRAPRGFVRVAPGAGGPGEVLVRFTDERRTRVLVWEPAARRLEARGEREGVVLASRTTARGADVLSAEPAPGTNHFEAPPRVRRGAAWKTPNALSAWLDLREADVTATARLAESGPSYALLDGSGALRLLRGDLSETGRVPSCGGAYALADWDGDAKAEPLCAGTGSGPADTLSLMTTGGARWTAEVHGTIGAIAAGPQKSGTAAAVFVREDGSPGTAIWLLRRTP